MSINEWSRSTLAAHFTGEYVSSESSLILFGIVETILRADFWSSLCDEAVQSAVQMTLLLIRTAGAGTPLPRLPNSVDVCI